jgi:hypothetical protein
LSRIGVMGEDATDVETLVVLLRRMVPRSVGVKTKAPPSGRGGCAKLVRSAPTYMKELWASGCSLAILLHDLDLDSANNELKDERKLHADLSRLPVPAGLELIICIPVEELEAWFWSDQAVLDRIGKDARASSSPHSIKKPKEKLKELSGRTHHKAKYATNQNPMLAEILNLDLCAQRCPAFASLREQVLRHFGT